MFPRSKRQVAKGKRQVAMGKWQMARAKWCACTGKVYNLVKEKAIIFGKWKNRLIIVNCFLYICQTVARC